MKKLLFILALALSTNAWGEVKDLICTAKVNAEILNLSWIKPRYKEDTNFIIPESLKLFNRCADSEIAWQHSIRLETDDIGKEDANVENTMIENCTSSLDYGHLERYAFRNHGKTKAYLMRTTPSYLLFSHTDPDFTLPLQVDRKTLKGYSNTKKVAFDCVLKDVEEKENIL